MCRLQLVSIAALVATACGASQSAQPATGSEPAAESAPREQSVGRDDGPAPDQGQAADDEFQLSSSDTAEQAHGERPSEIEASETHAAMRLFVVDPNTGPIEGIVIKMTGPDGVPYYTDETDSQGYAEVLVPVGRRYEIEYLSLGRRDVSANVEVPDGPNQDIRLTLRHRRRRTATPQEAGPGQVVLDGIQFESGRATIRPESHSRIDRVVEYMTHKPSVRIQVAGHTDNVGNPRRNQALSEARAEAVRDYLIAHGIDGSRIEAVGYGDQRPIASNDTEEGRQQNRRIEAIEL